MKKVHRPNRREKGFTLIELLVVVAILGVLAAVVVPNVSKFIGKGTDEAAKTEVQNVQLAMTAMMADKGLDEVTVVLPAAETGDMAAFPDATNQLAPYLQNQYTAYSYSCDATGKVTQGAKYTAP